MTQRTLQFDSPKLGQVRELVLELLSAGQWLTAEEVRLELVRRGFPISDAAATARCRDLRKPAYGGHRVECKLMDGKYRYRIV